MNKYRIIKKLKNSITEYILLYPLMEDDEIYEYSTIEEAQEKLDEIKNLSIYNDVDLLITSIDY